MAKLDDLLAKASGKSSTIAFKSPRKTLGLRETMRSIREQDSNSSSDNNEPANSSMPSVASISSNVDFFTPPYQTVSIENSTVQNGFKSAIPLASKSSFDKSTIGAQLEHKSDTNVAAELPLNSLKTEESELPIRAQLEHKSFNANVLEVPDKSTIRAQNDDSIDACSVLKEYSLEHNKSTNVDLDLVPSVFIGAQLEHEKDKSNKNKQEIDLYQKTASLEHNKSTIRAQTNKSAIIGAQLEHKTHSIRAQKASPLGHTLEHNKSTIHRLSGLEKRLLYFVYDVSLGRGGRTSGPLTKAVIIEGSKVSNTSFKTVVKRVVDKGFLKRLEAKRGNGGFLSFEIPFEVYQEIMLNENRSSIRAQLEHDKSTDRSTNASSKLVSYNNTNLLESSGTETVSPKEAQLSTLPEFLNVDISGLASAHIFKKHLMDLHNQKQFFTVQQMEDFVWKFREYVSDPEKVRGVRSIPALFVTLARQLASGYDPLESIKTPEQNLLNELIERNKKALMELKRQKDESKSLEFELWFEKLNRQERDELAPPNSIVESGSDLQKKSLMGYFDKAIWNG